MGRLPTASDLPKTIQADIVPPPNNDPPRNILLLLHGLGDTKASFTRLAQQLNLPETCCISLQAPRPMLDLGGFHWGDDILFDSNTGGLDPDAGFKESLTLLKEFIEETIVGKCGFAHRDVVMLGFGQGGMAALRVGADLPSSLSGMISIGGGLPSDAPASLINLSKTPVLICAGAADGGQTSITTSSEEKLKRNFSFVEIKRFRKPADSMPASRDEMMPIMQFLARRLRSGKGVPEGAVEVS